MCSISFENDLRHVLKYLDCSSLATWKSVLHWPDFTYWAAAGDIEKDFWLAYDLLQNPKDHAEFTIVRNWVQQALKVTISNIF